MTSRKSFSYYFRLPNKTLTPAKINSPVSGHPPDFSLVSAYGNNSRKRTVPLTDTFFNSWGFPLTRELTVFKISQEVQSRHLVTRCTESWEMYWHVLGNESKVRLTGLTTTNAEGDKLPVFVNIRDQTITPEIWRQPHYLEPPLPRTTIFLDTLESSRLRGSTVLENFTPNGTNAIVAWSLSIANVSSASPSSEQMILNPCRYKLCNK